MKSSRKNYSRFDSDVKDNWEDGLQALTDGISKTLKKEEDIVHPQTGLTPHQIADVRRTWENVRKDRIAMVSRIFIKSVAFILCIHANHFKST